MNRYHVTAERRLSGRLQRVYLIENKSGQVATSLTIPAPMPKPEADMLYGYACMFMPEWGIAIRQAS